MSKCLGLETSNLLAALSLAAVIKVAIEVIVEISTSCDGIVLGVLILLLSAVNVIICSGLAVLSSTVRRCSLISTNLSIVILSFDVFFERFFASSGDVEDRFFFALICLSLAPFTSSLLSVSSGSGGGWGLASHLFGFGVAFVTQLALLLSYAFSSSLWLTWLYYLIFSLLLARNLANLDKCCMSLRKLDGMCGGIVSPEESAAAPDNEAATILKVTEESRIIRQLIGNVAHDLKTPLSSFMVGLGLIQDWMLDLQHLLRSHPAYAHNEAQNEAQMVLFNQITTALHDAQVTDTFMIATINRCIEYTKCTTGIKLTAKNESVKVCKAINFALLCMQHSCTQFLFKAVYPVDDNDAIASHVFTDQQWLQENLLCLLSNAAKYSHSGEITMRVYLQPRSMIDTSLTRDLSMEDNSTTDAYVAPSSSLTPAATPIRLFSISSSVNNNHLIGEDLVFEVEDHGIGVPEAKKPFLFGAFAQTQKMAGGTGLGLYSLAKRVQVLNGSYGVRSRHDGKQGSCFWFAIPYHPDDAAASSSSLFEAVVEHDHHHHRLLLPPVKMIGSSSSNSSRCNSYDYNTNNTERISHHLHHRRASFAALNLPKSSSPSPDKESFTSSASVSPPSTAMIVSEEALTPQQYHHDRRHQRHHHHHRPPPPQLHLRSPLSYDSSAASCTLNTVPEQKRRILLVDDSQPIVKVTKMLLQRHGYEVDIAENGFVAVQFIEKYYSRSGDFNRYEVVLMDLHMPVMDGLEATKRIRALELIHNVRSNPLLIVGLSANSDDGTLATVAEAGFDSFMAKPFRIEDFRALLLKMKQAASFDVA